jgi:hypothetical protein
MNGFRPWLRRSPNTQYIGFTILLLVLLVALPVPNSMPWQIIFQGILLASMVSMSRSFYTQRSLFFGLVGLAIAAFCFSISHTILGNQLSKGFLLWGVSLHIVLLIIFMLLLLQSLILSNQVTADTIFGGVCVYLLVGVLWMLFYSVVILFDPQALALSDALRDSRLDEALANGDNRLGSLLMYFSFTTLTTLGYGDISPMTPIARSLTNLEAIFGQLYPAIFLARLVSLHSAQPSEIHRD